MFSRDSKIEMITDYNTGVRKKSGFTWRTYEEWLHIALHSVALTIGDTIGDTRETNLPN